jgi:hypothetical protein
MRHVRKESGSVLVLVAVSLLILAVLGLGLLTVGYGARFQGVSSKNKTLALLAAEAGYEKAVYWMSQQEDLPTAVNVSPPGITGTITFANSDCDYGVDIYTFVGHRPVYRVTSNGRSGRFNRTVDVFLVQAIGGWDMGVCRAASSSTATAAMSFENGETIDIPLHVNKLADTPDESDIYIDGNPQFLQTVAVSESRDTSGGSDKYAGMLDVFEGGIYFDQPSCRIADESCLQSKIDRFKHATLGGYKFTPQAGADVPNPVPAVQLEFFVEDDTGKVRITEDCTVRGFVRESNDQTWDFKITPGSGGSQYERYYIYAYHLRPTKGGTRKTWRIDQTYVKQQVRSVQSELGGQIYVDGNVIVGGDMGSHSGDQVVKGTITLVATGNIWIADSVLLDGPHDADGKPASDNPNSLGLVAQGVIRVVDPGMSDYDYVDDEPIEPTKHEYVPVGRHEVGQPVHVRYLPDPTMVEAAITVGRGGWGAENVVRKSGGTNYGGRKNVNNKQDELIVHGTIAEAIRGIIGSAGKDGYTGHYYHDKRVLEGILPGDIWLQAKYVPAPAGWRDYRPS